MFREDLLTQLRRAQVDRKILVMDANEDVIDGEMCKHLRTGELNMKEVVYSQTHMRGPTTYGKGHVAIGKI